jgi:hypothetical protein
MRMAGALFAVAALGELGVGLAVLAFPEPVTGFLLAPIEGVGAVVARMLGIAVAGLGLTWWLARDDLRDRLRRLAPGFIVYNLGVGFVFLRYALAVNGPLPVPWVVAGVHLLAGAAFAGTVLAQLRRGPFE